MTQLGCIRINAIVAQKVWLRVNLHHVALHAVEHVSPRISGVVRSHLHSVVRHIRWLESDTGSSLHAVFNHHAIHATSIGNSRSVFHHFCFKISSIHSVQVGTDTDGCHRQTTVDGIVESGSWFITNRPSDGSSHMVERSTTLRLHDRQNRLDVTIVGTVANHNVHRFSTTGNGVADGRSLRIVALSVNGCSGDLAISFHRHHSTLSRRNREDRSAIQLRPVGPVAIGNLTIGRVEVELHVNRLTVHLCLRHVNACCTLIRQ